MRAPLAKILGDLRQRRLQTLVVLLIVTLAASVGTLAIALMRESAAPYTQAFDQYQGAHLTMIYRGAAVSPAQLRATTRLPEVTASAGPWQASYTSVGFGLQKVILLVVGRADPDGTVDRLRLLEGRWVSGPDEIVLTRSFAQQLGVGVGSQLRTLTAPTHPRLTVVGEVADIDEASAINFSPQFAWVQPPTLPALLPPGQAPYVMLLYRFRHAATDTALQQRTYEITAITTASAVESAFTYTSVMRSDTLASTLTLTFLLAFATFALGAVALIVANVVNGVALASQRDIGIIKALGFTPGQVVLTFVGQMLAPSLVGCALGGLLGTLGSQPLVASSATAIGLPAPLALDAVAPLLATVGALLVVTLAAALPAWRTALLHPAEVITRSAAPAQRDRRWRHALARPWRALPLPRLVILGVGNALARPVRGLLTALAVMVGVATLVFALGLSATFQRISSNRALFNGADVTITRYGDYPDAALMRTLNAQPATQRVIANTYFTLAAPHLSSPIEAVTMRGDSAAQGFPLIAGRWFRGPGEVVGGPAFLQEARLAVGDSFTATLNGHPLRLRLVGEYFEFNNFGRDVRLDWSTYLRIDPQAQPLTYQVNLRPGANVAAYSQRVAATAPDALSVATNANLAAPVIGALNGVLAILVAILSLIAVVGVFNTMQLITHEGIRDTATLKALGMTPAQVIAMTLTSAGVIGALGGALGVAAGLWLHHSLLALVGNIIGESLPLVFITGVYTPWALPLLGLAGVAVAALGAAFPAWLAARAPVAEVLRAD